jgi:hypothetical protein
MPGAAVARRGWAQLYRALLHHLTEGDGYSR